MADETQTTEIPAADEKSPAAQDVPATGSPSPVTSEPAPAKAVDAGEAKTGEVAPASPPEGAKNKSSEPKKDWRDLRIQQLTAKLRESEKAVPAPAAEPAAQATEAEINQRAAMIAAQQMFNKRCDDVAAEGKKAYSDFNEHLGQLQQLVNPADANETGAYIRLLEAALETGEAPRVLYELGGDMNEAQRMMALAQRNPMKLAIELAKIALKQGESAPSDAPKPITTIGSRGAQNTNISPDDPNRADRLSVKEWMDRRAADVAKKQKDGVRIW